MVIVILIAAVGYFGYNQYIVKDKHVKVGAATFTLPEGYHVGTLNKNNDTNITNGYDAIFLRDCGNDNITKYIKNFVKLKKSKENTTKVKVKNFTVDDTIVYKVYSANNTSNVHYWFEHNGEVYTIYSWSASRSTDKIVTDLIKSVK